MKIPASFKLKQKRRSSKQISAKSIRNRNRNFILQYLSTHPCVDCNNTNIIVLEFDHHTNKSYDISNLVSKGYSIAAIQVEIDKCDVRCANCHRIKTAKERNSYKHRNK